MVVPTKKRGRGGRKVERSPLRIAKLASGRLKLDVHGFA